MNSEANMVRFVGGEKRKPGRPPKVAADPVVQRNETVLVWPDVMKPNMVHMTEQIQKWIDTGKNGDKAILEHW